MPPRNADFGVSRDGMPLVATPGAFRVCGGPEPATPDEGHTLGGGVAMGRTGTTRRRRRVRTRRRAGSLVRFAAVGGALVAVLVGTSLNARPQELEIEPELLTRLQTLAGGLHQEIVLCLEGRVRGRRAIVDDFVMPVPRLSTPTRSSFERCPRGTLASWHNHPPGMLASADPSDRTTDKNARRLCVLSETDIRTAERLAHPFVVVSVDARTWCWWGLDEVERFAERAISPAPPSPDRIARADGTAAWARPATAGAQP
ncbi:MAG: hypothetical protein R3195_03225 [Gemmatimonadota bacterium]|nr:hypothetical protein [Gemmatimonadota bacterium]